MSRRCTVKYSQVIIVRIGHIEGFTIRGQGDAVGGGTDGRIGGHGGMQGFYHFAGSQVNDGYRIGVGIGYVQPFARAVDGHVRGMIFRVGGILQYSLPCIVYPYFTASPCGNIQFPFYRVQQTGIGFSRKGNFLQHLHRLCIAYIQGVVFLGHHIQPVPGFIQGKARRADLVLGPGPPQD